MFEANPVIQCELCTELVYYDQMARHMAKDHDPEQDRELELVGKCIDLGLTIDKICRLVYG